jgi:Tol biopolymer transport system component
MFTTRKTPLALFLLILAMLALPAGAQATIAFVKYERYPFVPKVFAAENNGFNAHPIGRGTDPRVSPDGRWVAYVSEAKISGHERLKVVPASGGRANLLIDAADISSVTWSGDSSKLAAVRGSRLGRDKLVLIDIPSGGQRRVARGFFSGVSFSPDGAGLVYSRARNQRAGSGTDVFVASTSSRRRARLTYDGRSMRPLWGPDEEIAFVKKERKHSGDIFLMNPQGGEVVRMTRHRFGHARREYFPVDWSEDGERLLVNFQGRNGLGYAELFDLEIAAHWPLQNPIREFVGAAISADGEQVLGSSGGFRPLSNHLVGTVPAGGGRMHVLAQFAYEPDWSQG